MRLDGAPSKLIRHPDTPRGAIWRASAWYERDASGGLALRYALYGAVDNVIVPAPATPARKDDLWKHTCFEAFVRPGPSEEYYEFNFSPSGEWAAYRFESYRAGMRPALDIEAPTISAALSAEGEQFVLIARVQTPFTANSVRLKMSAIVEETDGSKTYWAFGHPSGKPDFHHADGFGFAPLPVNS